MVAMRKGQPKQIDPHVLSCKSAQEFHAISHQIFYYANRGFLRSEFLHEVSKILMNFSGCDAVELWVKERGKYYRCEATQFPKKSVRFVIMPCVQNEKGQILPSFQTNSDLERLCRYIVRGHLDLSLPFFTRNGSFWTGNTENPLPFYPETDRQAPVHGICIGGNYRSLALIPLEVGNENIGLLQLKSKQRDYFTQDEIEFYEGVVKTLGDALAYRSAQVALRERIKELTCLYGIAQLVARPGISLEGILEGVVKSLPSSWMYPKIAAAEIFFDGRSYSTPGFRESRWKQTSDIVVNGERRGVVVVVYTEEKPELDQGPFLKEERILIDTVAREVALIIEQRQAEEERLNFQGQLRHADRLATIGQLAAGVAHELNEPLGNILGFAQLAKKCPGLPKGAKQDIERIVTASMYTREVIKKLMLFARQTPPRKTSVNLNKVVEEGLYFFESRCSKEGIKLVRLLSPDLPEITADLAQLNQVLVNLVVNAVQAMSEGGSLTVRTLACEDSISLIVEDTGVGMTKEVVDQIFLPFFTTKEVGQGTGLGLAVVHGVVTSHGGTIKVESEVGRGTRFEIQLPVARLRE
jgi:two-component system NtrC family sensor kinase